MRKNILVLLSCAALLGACANDTETSTTTLTMGFAGLEDLGTDYVYEGWLIVDGAPVTAGRFSVDADGNPTPATIELDEAVVAAATTFVLTIEPTVGDDPAPSAVHILAGDIVGDSVDLTTSHGAALGTDFSSATGEFILETPSSMAPEDYAQGIWWLVPGTDGMAPGLALPTLPDGWTYEGWVVGPSGPVSTGTFASPDGADSDAAGPDAGPDGAGPPFPGQDFISPAQVLTGGYMAVISVEPVPDNSPMPFAIKPLADMDLEDVMAPMTQSMNNIAADTVPAGSISLGLSQTE